MARRRSALLSPKPRATASAAAPLACEGLAFAIAERGQSPRQGFLEAKRALRETFGEQPAWRVTPVAADVKEYLAAPARAPYELPIKTAWEQARRLAEHPLVADAEPALRGPGIAPADPRDALTRGERARFAPGGPPRARALLGAAGLGCAAVSDWHLPIARVTDAWAAFPARGAGIRVAHPDTGYTQHDEIWSVNPADNRIIAGFDFLEGDVDPVDELDGGLFEFPGHGTGTASVIMSGVGGPLAHFVSGAAPEALLSPLRVSRSVIHLSYGNLIRALDFAREQDHHVVSMSLGGPLPSWSLERAVRRATNAGLIVVAAAGNYWPVVTYPGAFDDVVTVGACNCAEHAWQFSSPGPEVDVAAPGESVWVARSALGAPFTVGQGSGTSFGAAVVAGVAALWLSHHGRDALIAQYGRPGVPRVFRHLLRTSGMFTPPGWDTASHGAGIVNARTLLETPLPAALPAPAAPRVRAASAGARPPGRALAAVQHAVPDLEPAAVRAALARVLNVSEAGLEPALAEVGHEVAVHASIDPAFRDALRAAAAPGAPPPVARPPRGRARAGARPGVRSRSARARPAPASPHLRRAGSDRLLRMMRAR